MDRVIAYVDENILVEDFLNSQKNTLIALGAFMQAVFGTATWVDGLACTPTSPYLLQVQVAKGSIYSIENVDNSAYGPLSSDTTHQIIKQGISLGITNFTLTPPSTSGQSINYLIQAEYQDVDAGSTVLPYYNASNPSVAYSGPSNTGVSQNTLRRRQAVMSLKAAALRQPQAHKQRRRQTQAKVGSGRHGCQRRDDSDLWQHRTLFGRNGCNWKGSSMG